MRLNIKATHLELTPSIKQRIEGICAKLEKIVAVDGEDAVKCAVEIEKITEHHHKGNIFRAEINMTILGAYVRAVAEGETIFSALDDAHDEIKREITHGKEKRHSAVRRTGARLRRK